MAQPKTFAQYLIDKTLPQGMQITKQVDKSYLNEILTTVAKSYADQYGKVVVDLKRLADHMSTMEAVTMGLDEIDVPNKAKRDQIITKYTGLLAKEQDKTGDKAQKILVDLQNDLAKNDLDGTKDDATIMVKSSLTGKKYQLMKMRTSPGVVSDHKGNIVPEIFPKSYAQGIDPLHFWLGATESRKNIAEGQVNTAKPGEMSKVISNVLAGAVVSSADCGTEQGILLGVRDDSIIDRYLAKDTGQFKRNTLITPDVQQALLKSGATNVLVRSPQTCNGKSGTCCQMCMGLRPGTGKKYEIGDNAGLISAGNMSEPLTQMTLSAKHSTSLAGGHTGLYGEAGFRQFVESPESYPNRKILCEVIGTVLRIRPAPQGGKTITIRQTRVVPDRYIVNAMKTPNMKLHWDYHIPPNLKIAEGIEEGKEVWPGMELSTGVDNLKDVARLRNLGFARSVSAENMYNIYKNTGSKIDRRHFELLARQSNPYVKIVKAPRGYDLLPGETIAYQELQQKVTKLPQQRCGVKDAVGKVLGQGVLNLTVGTEIDAQTAQYLLANNVKDVTVCNGLEIEAVTVPMTRVVNQSQDWVAALNHRYLKEQLKDAASTNKKSNIHGFNPVTAYAYGVELGHNAEGRY